MRRSGDEHQAGILALLRSSLEWVPGEEAARFYQWKHVENPFGASPAWVALDGGRVVGLRTFLRWEFERDGGVVRAVRAVDTATHPGHRGRGIFRTLTEQALDELRAEGVAFVFNTPNDQSRPGYVKMGWRVLGRLPVLARPRSPLALVRMAQARVPASLSSVPGSAGVPASDVLGDRLALAALLDALPPAAGMRTRRTPEYLAWRYGFEPLAYRAVTGPHGPADGVAFFRLRRRGASLEAAVGDVLVPGGPRAARPLLRRILRESGAHHAVRLAGDGLGRQGYLPVPRLGPVLAFRALVEQHAPPLGSWRLSVGDVELF